MIILTKRIELPDNANYEDIEDAKITADRKGWKREYTTSQQERLKTDLDGKCGSCKYFKPFENESLKFHGECEAGRVWGARTRPKCKGYEHD